MREAPYASTARSRPARFTDLRFQEAAEDSLRVDHATSHCHLSRAEKGPIVHLGGKADIGIIRSLVV